MTKIRVEAGLSLLESYVRKPPAGVCELIWNAFDEDARLVEVLTEHQELGGLESLIIRDDGRGMNVERARLGFSRVGDSWKRMEGTLSQGGRPVHGRQGRGRYAAFSLGERVRWSSISPTVEGAMGVVSVLGSRSQLDEFEITNDQAAESAATGTTVTITQLTEDAVASFAVGNDIRQHVLAEFALHLNRFPDFAIEFLGSRLDPTAVMDQQAEFELVDETSWEGVARLTVIEWNLTGVRRALYLCDDGGRVVDEVEARVKAPGAEFTAYLSWDGFAGSNPITFEDDSETSRGRLITAARERLREHLSERSRHREAEVVKRWKEEGVYPFKAEPTNAIEAATRDAFNVVALASVRTLEESKSTNTTALALSLMREAMENDPASLIPILRDVAKLPKSRIDELRELLSRTTLTQLIQVGREVGSRLDFLSGLQVILFERQTRARLLERRQLHRMLAHETWIFGEEWSLTGDDVRLTRVLDNYLNFLGKPGEEVELATAKPVLLEDGTDAIPDLVLGRQLETDSDVFRMLVVELKRPSHKLDDTDVSQLRGYASKIVSDESFKQPNVEWEFWLVGNDIATTVDEQRRQSQWPHGVVQVSPYKIVVKTWAEVISAAEHRLKFVQKSLQYETNRDGGLAYLREKYGEYLPADVMPEPSREAEAPGA